jgi:hypothetical protein
LDRENWRHSTFKPECGDRCGELARLIFQRRRGSGGLLHEGGILLGNLIHLRHGLIYLLDSYALIRAG